MKEYAWVFVVNKLTLRHVTIKLTFHNYGNETYRMKKAVKKAPCGCNHACLKHPRNPNHILQTYH